ncbi:MAG: hypothetical protein Q4E36_03900 [Bacillota bacterium]|nr:hypothetical protein [Bacillota bacterium]
MEYSKNISKTMQIFIANLGTILIVYLILSAVELIAAFSLDLSSSLTATDPINILDKTDSIGTGTKFFTSLIQGVLVQFILGTNQIAILKLLRGKEYSIDSIIEIAKENYRDLGLVSLLITIITSLIALIPLLGGFLTLVAKLAFSFAFFLIYDYKADNPQNYLKASANLTNGHKVKLFVLEIIYSALPIIIGVVSLIAALIAQNLALGAGMILVFILLLSLTSILLSISHSVYYDELMEEEPLTE